MALLPRAVAVDFTWPGWLQPWRAQNVKDLATGDLAVKQLVARNVLPEKEARARVRDLVGR